MAEYYVIIPSKIIYDVGAKAAGVYAYLKDQAKGFSPGLRTISENCQLSKSTVIKILEQLESSGWITIDKTSMRNSYIINDQSVPKENRSKIEPVQNRTGSGLKENRKWSKIEPEVVQNRTTTNNETNTKTSNDTNTNSKYKLRNEVSGKKREQLNKEKKKNIKKKKKPDEDINKDDRAFARDWIAWLADRGSHHAKTAVASTYASHISTLRRKYGLTHARLPEMKKLVSQDAFWASNLISPNGLLKKWKNGTNAISNLMDALEKQRKNDEALLWVDPTYYERMEYYENNKEMQNVTPKKPALIEGD